MTAYRLVCDSRRLQADCQEPESAPEPYAPQSSMGYLYLFLLQFRVQKRTLGKLFTVYTRASAIKQ